MSAGSAERIRKPAVAGTFYPAEPARLNRMIETFLAEAKAKGPGAERPKALIAPHAGYIYSGPIAGSAFVHWRDAGQIVRRVVLIGPSHFVPFQGLALSRAEAWATPLGRIEVDQAGAAEIASLSQVTYLDEAHAAEHSLEVELAFIQHLLPRFTILPLVIGEADSDAVSEVMARVWGGEETVFVISSDLSHYYDYATACRIDAATAEAIETLAPDKIKSHQACGRLAIQGLLQVARDRKMRVARVDLRNSGDTAGRKDRVVGYGAFTFCETAALEGRSSQAAV
jgi:hypothetical protein